MSGVMIPRMVSDRRHRWLETLGLIRTTYEMEISNSSAYRGALIGWAILSGAPIVASFLIWRMVLETNNGQLAGWSIQHFITYQILTSLLFAVNTPWSLMNSTSNAIRMGELNAYLIRPMNFGLYCLARYAAYNTVFLALMIIPTALLLLFFQDYLLFSSPLHLLGFAAAVGLGYLLQFLATFAFALLAFWWDEVGSFFIAYVLISRFAGGETLPLRLLPEWLSGLLEWSPFPYIGAFAVNTYMGEIDGAAFMRGAALAGAWIVALLLLVIFMWRRGMKKYGAYGG